MNTEATANTGDEDQAQAAEVEWFQMLAWRWNVTKAKQITTGRTPNGIITTAEWKGMLRMIVIDEHHAEGVDLSEPLIAVPVPSGGLLIIDGWHRLHKALDTGTETLRAHLLSADEELACRMSGGEKGHGWR